MVPPILRTLQDVHDVALSRFEINLTPLECELIFLSLYESPNDELLWLKRKMELLNLFKPGCQTPRARMTTLLHVETISGGIDKDDLYDLLISGWPRQHLEHLPRRDMSPTLGNGKYRHGYTPEYVAAQYSGGLRFPHSRYRKEK